MKYFVTGATGFIGGHVVRQLREDGHDVVALVRTPTHAAELGGLGAILHSGDITDKESMRRGMAGVDGVFHIAGWYKVGVRDNSIAARINVDGTRNVLELMRELNIPRGVYTSTVSVFSDTHGQLVDESYYFNGRHLTEYDRTKWLAHYEVALPMIQQGLPLVIVQPGAVYGPGDRSRVQDTLVQFLQRKLPAVPARNSQCWGHVADVARGHLLAMEKGTPGECYILAGPNHTLIEALQIAERITGLPAPTRQLSPTTIRILAALMKVVAAVFPVPEAYHPESLRSIARVSYLGDNSKAKRELGYNPRPLEEGLRETLCHEMSRFEMTSPS